MGFAGQALTSSFCFGRPPKQHLSLHVSSSLTIAFGGLSGFVWLAIDMERKEKKKKAYPLRQVFFFSAQERQSCSAIERKFSFSL